MTEDKALQKAKELFGKFCNAKHDDGSFTNTSYNDAKLHCLICVDEILLTVFTHKNSYDFWQQVKEKIQSL